MKRWCTALLLVSFASGGCTRLIGTFGTPLPDPQEVLQLEQSTYADVLDHIGPPHGISSLDGGMVFLYEAAVARESQIGLHLPGSKLAELLKFVYAKTDLDRQVLVVAFDRSGRVTAHRYLTWGASLDDTFMIQLFFAVRSGGDLTDLNAQSHQSDWGRRLLAAPPRSLNRNSSLETGRNGLELKGTTTSVGQHALEMN